MERYPFLLDLGRTQRAWSATYAALAAAGPSGSTAVLRRRVLSLSADLRRHTFWRTVAAGPAARAELRAARTKCEEVRAA
ncbi:hypothetical protein ACIRTB_21060 [Streptomyces sp. NPDC101158]|uniref:hypothetical protein n=1 Tax=Streptomyces sp. NPDC101158 TaxID=3366117 RepID=UPI0037FEFC1C